MVLCGVLTIAAVSMTSCAKEEESSTPSASQQMAARKAATNTNISETDNFIIEAKGEINSVSAAVTSNNGQVLRTHADINLVVATSTDPNFFANMSADPSVKQILHDYAVDYTESNQMATLATTSIINGFTSTVTNPGNNPLYGLQWSHQAINTQAAWTAGYTGAGVRVAIVDGGFHPTHEDIAANVNMSLSTNFVVGEVLTSQGGFPHGTHVAGIIAAIDNNKGVIGVAPDVEIVMVKALSDAGEGSFEDVIAGIMYAADIDADIINMSIGALLPIRGNAWPPGVIKEIRALVNMTGKAIQYANNKGTAVIVAAGNDFQNPQASGNIVLPAMNAQCLSVASLGPQGFGTTASTTNFDVQAWYTNYGIQVVDVSASGGYYNPAYGSVAVYDAVISLGEAPSNYIFAQGTSMACPQTVGVAALILEKHGSLSPGQLYAKIKQTSDDLGKSGRDEVYGHGRINAAKAVQ